MSKANDVFTVLGKSWIVAVTLIAVAVLIADEFYLKKNTPAVAWTYITWGTEKGAFPWEGMHCRPSQWLSSKRSIPPDDLGHTKHYNQSNNAPAKFICCILLTIFVTHTVNEEDQDAFLDWVVCVGDVAFHLVSKLLILTADFNELPGNDTDLVLQAVFDMMIRDHRNKNQRSYSVFLWLDGLYLLTAFPNTTRILSTTDAFGRVLTSATVSPCCPIKWRWWIILVYCLVWTNCN